MTNPRDTRRLQPAAALEPARLPSATPVAVSEPADGVWSPALANPAPDAAASPGLTGIRRQAWLRKGIPELASPLAG